QSVNFLAGTYTIRFEAAQRPIHQASSQTFQVLLDAKVVGRFTPAGTEYAPYESDQFAVTAGVHTIKFEGLNPNGGDNTACIDNVHIVSVDKKEVTFKFGDDMPSVSPGSKAATPGVEHPREILAVAFSYDSKLLAGQTTHGVKVWEVATGKER